MKRKQEAFLVDYVDICILVKLNSIDTLMVSMRRKEDGIVNIAIKNFVKTGISCVMKDIVQALDENMSLLIAISIHQIVSNNIFLTKVYNFICIFIFYDKNVNVYTKVTL